MSSTECNDRIEAVKLTAEMMKNFPLEGADSTVKRVGFVLKSSATTAGYGASCYRHADNARAAYEEVFEAYNNMMPTNRAGWDGNIRDVLINDYYLQKDRLYELIQTPTDPLRIAIWVEDIYDIIIASNASQIWDDAAWEMGLDGNVDQEIVPDRMKVLYYLPAAFDWHFFELSTLFKDLGVSKELYETLKTTFEKYFPTEKWPLDFNTSPRNIVTDIPKRL